MTATALWAAVVSSYDADGLIALTNIRDPAATAIDTPAGENAAQDVIDLWPVYAEIAYDASNKTHETVAKYGVIAVLWRRGGTSSTIEQVKWEEVFSPGGMIARVRQTGPRGRGKPKTNSGVTQKAETVNGRNVRGWSDRESLPVGYLPGRTLATD